MSTTNWNIDDVMCDIAVARQCNHCRSGLRPAGPGLLGEVGKNEAEIVAMLAALWLAQA